MMTPRVGIDAYSLLGDIVEGATVDVLERVRALGADGLQATLPSCEGQARELFAAASDWGMYLEPYIKLPVHWSNDAELIDAREREFEVVTRLASELGARTLHCSIGAGERFEDFARWQEYKQQVASVVRRLAPRLEERGLRLGIENHGDFTTRELVQLADASGSTHVGVGLDTGNLLYLAEDVRSAAERVAPIVHSVHLKDALLFPHPHGAQRSVAAPGTGQIDFDVVIGTLLRANPELNLTIEDHGDVLPVPFFDRDWLARLPELSAVDIAASAELTARGGRLLREHRLADPHAVDAIPWELRAPGRLRAGIAAIRAAAGRAIQNESEDES